MFSRDSKRIQGPLNTRPISSFAKKDDCKTAEENDGDKLIPLCNENGRRIDGRKLDECLPVYLRTGIVTKAKGSSYFEKSGAKIICAVYGPRESQRKTEFSTHGKLICEVTFAPFSQKERQFKESKTKNLTNLLETALQCAVCLESFPKSQVEINVKILQDSGDVLAPAIICASLALADADIEMYDLVTACSLVFDDEQIALDPLIDEMSQTSSRGVLTIGYLPSLNIMSCIMQDGIMDSERSIACIKECIRGCIRTHSVMKDCLVAGAKRKEEMKKYESSLE